MLDRLDPQAKVLLEQLAASPAEEPLPHQPLSSAEQIAASRLGYHQIAAWLAGEPEPVLHLSQRQIPGPYGPISLRLYQPQEATNLPVFIYMHGGGFFQGDLDTHDRPLRALANRSGWLIVSIDYHLAPEYPFPAGLEDVYAAIQWVSTHAAEINADPRLLAVGGDSAGGLLATVATMMARDRKGPAITLQVLLYPDTDGHAGYTYQSWRDFDGVILNRTQKDRELELVYRNEDRDHPYISPVSATDLAGLPPALIITGEYDPLRDEGEAYAERLKQAGNVVTLRRYPGMIHGFFGAAGVLDAGKAVIDQVAQALQEVAKR